MAPPTRDPLSTVERFLQFSLLGMLASGFLALAGTGVLDWASGIALLVVFVARGAKVSGFLKFDLNNRAVAVWTLVGVCFYPVDLWFLSRSTYYAPALHLAVILTALKVLTAKNNRDYLYLKTIAAIELAGAAMLAIDLSFLIFLGLFLLFAVAAQTSGEVRKRAGTPETLARTGQRAFGRRLVTTSFVLCCGILTMTAGLFFVLPRAARGAMSHFLPNRPRLPGFADKVTLGDIGRIQQSSRAVMHIRSDKGESLEGVRWRGAALSRFDGQTWDNPRLNYQKLPVDRDGLVEGLGTAQQRRPGREFGYQVQMDEVASDTLFFAGTPETIRIALPLLWRSSGGAFRVLPFAPDGLSYRAYSFVEDENAEAIVPPTPLAASEREALLALPENTDPRIGALARVMASDASGPNPAHPELIRIAAANVPTGAANSPGVSNSDEAKARAIERHLRHDYGYTLELPSVKVRDPIANFLFVRKKGHCEYFASAMAVMLRSIKIPARVVTGFQSGVYNRYTGWQVVRASEAHSWVEAWTPSGGWTVFDPTPAGQAESDSLLSRLALFYDAADQFWQNWVLRFDFERQIVLAARVQQSGRQFRFSSMPDVGAWWDRHGVAIGGGAAIMMFLAALALLVALYAPEIRRWWRSRRGVIRAQRGEGQSSDATLLYQRMLTVLEKRGFKKPPWLTPSEFARVLPASETAVLVDDLTTAYNEFRFGGKREAAPRMIRLLDLLENARLENQP